jgi:hypothetical protein
LDNQFSIASRSYVWPSEVITGSLMICCVMGHLNSSIRLPKDNREFSNEY